MVMLMKYGNKDKLMKRLLGSYFLPIYNLVYGCRNRKTQQTSRQGLFHLYLLQFISEQGRCLFLRLASNFFCSVSRSLSILLLILHILLLTCLFTLNNAFSSLFVEKDPQGNWKTLFRKFFCSLYRHRLLL